MLLSVLAYIFVYFIIIIYGSHLFVYILGFFRKESNNNLYFRCMVLNNLIGNIFNLSINYNSYKYNKYPQIVKYIYDI